MNKSNTVKRVLLLFILLFSTFVLVGCFKDDEIIVCLENQELVDGECQDIIVDCPVGQELVDNVCQDVVITCDAGYELIDGECQQIIIENLTVFFQSPEGWEDVYIYYYNASPSIYLSWEEAPEMSLIPGNPGWYVYTFPFETEMATVMFKDGAGHQIPGSNQPGQEITESTWFYSDFITNTTENPFTDLAPIIQVYPSGGEFEETIDVGINIISTEEILSVSYILDDVQHDMELSNPYVEIGDGVEVGETITLIIKAENEFGETITEEFVYTKIPSIIYEELDQIVEYNNLRIYQIYVSAYQDGIPGGYEVGYGPSNHQGDIQGIIDSLDYIADLGVNAIWLTPIFESRENTLYNQWEERGRATGYFADDYYNIDPNFGTNELFRELVVEAHNRGLYVLLDGVFGHHGSYSIDGVVDGNSQWYGYEALYPESLDFYIDVATYWIEEYDIDGWRLDQSYQLYQDDYNYIKDIREAVEELCEQRRNDGEEWGVLGYLVGEIWNNSSFIDIYGYQQNGLRSAFDFPLRYALVKALAVDENQDSSALYLLDDILDYQYPGYAQPNMFITNHDLVRFGDLIEFAELDHEYWQRHKMALSFLTAYTGPITIYYGDEYGAEYSGLENSVSDLDYEPYIAPDNVARDNGQIAGFTAEQLDLINYVSVLMQLREDYSCLWNGERINLLVTDTVYVDLKTDEYNQIVYALNIASEDTTIQISSDDIDGTMLTNLITDEEIYAVEGVFTIVLSELSGSFFLVE